jgi:predicted site-specific integrase-resolvase
MKPLYNQNEIAFMLNINKETVYNHIKKLGIKPVRTKHRFKMYDPEDIDKIKNNVWKREVVKYYPMKTTEIFHIYESKMNK